MRGDSMRRALGSTRRTKKTSEPAMKQNSMAVARPQPAAPMAGSPNLPKTKMMFSGMFSARPMKPATMAGRVCP